jgi:GNAT superfamily N-acetyltransferase
MQAATTEIRATTVDELRQHAGALVVEHWDEVERLVQSREPQPNWPRMVAMEAVDVMFARGLWVGDELAGYSVNIVFPSLHYSGLTQVTNTALFLAKQHRRDGLGRRLVEDTKREARRRGAEEVLWHAKGGTAAERLFVAMGADVIDTTYRMRV